MGGKKRKQQKNKGSKRRARPAPKLESAAVARSADTASSISSRAPVETGGAVESVQSANVERGEPREAVREPEAEAPAASEPRLAAESAPDSTPHRSDHRVHTRVALAVEISLESDSHFFSGLSGDVSEGGVFVQTYRDLPVGAEVDLEFDLPSGHVETHGTVRWHRTNSDSAPPGVGIAFEDLDDDEREKIHEFCAARAPLYYEVEHA